METVYLVRCINCKKKDFHEEHEGGKLVCDNCGLIGHTETVSESEIDDIKNRNASQRRNRFTYTPEEGYLKKDYKKMTEEKGWDYDPLTFSSPKITFLRMQLWRTYKKYRDLDHVDFYFFDDREDILKKLKEHFSSSNNGGLFKKITLHLVQYDWFSYFENPKKARIELEDYATFSK